LRVPLLSRMARCGDLLLCAKHLFVAAILAEDRQRATPFLKERDTTSPLGLVMREPC
jgi:hypothetical protein